MSRIAYNIACCIVSRTAPRLLHAVLAAHRVSSGVSHHVSNCVFSRCISHCILPLNACFIFLRFLASRYAKALVSAAVDQRNHFEDILILRAWRLYSSGPFSPLWGLSLSCVTTNMVWVACVKIVTVWCLAAHMVWFITDAGHDSSSGRSTTQCTSVIMDARSGEIIKMLWKLRGMDPSTGRMETRQGMEPRLFAVLQHLILFTFGVAVDYIGSDANKAVHKVCTW